MDQIAVWILLWSTDFA